MPATGAAGGTTSGVEPVEVQLRIVDDQLYVNAPPEAGGNGEWEALDARDAGGMDPSQGLATTSPFEMVRLLEDASAFEEAGSEELAGENMSRYEGTLDIAALAEDAQPGAAQTMSHLGLDELPAEVLVDDEGRLRKVTFTIDLAGAAPSTSAAPPSTTAALPTVTFELELHDFGTELSVEAPEGVEPPEN